MADEKDLLLEDLEDEIITGELSGTIPSSDELLVGTVSDAKEVRGELADSGAISGKNAIEGVAGATLTLRPGIDGQDGKDGFSPTITVEKDTKTEYVLKITDVNGSYLTPNLYPDIKGFEDIPTLVAGKVDEDLLEYPVMDPKPLSIEQREETYFYTNSLGLNRKVALSEFALEKETEEKIRTKLQTVGIVPDAGKWRIGDFILLDHVPTDKE